MGGELRPRADRAQHLRHRRLGRLEASVEAFDRALELDPREPQIWFDAGLSRAYLERYDEAERYYARTLAIAPHYTEGQVFLAINRCNREATVEACRRELAALDPAALWEARQTGFAWRLALQAHALDEAFAQLAVAGEMVSLQEYDYPRELLAGITHRLAGDAGAAMAAFRSAASLLEATLRDRPDYAPHRGALGLAYAGLGRHADAVREARRAVELLPVERDLLVGGWQLADLGFVQVELGQHDAAAETFERYFSRPAMYSVGAFALDPRLEPLRDHPRFRALVERRR